MGEVRKEFTENETCCFLPSLEVVILYSFGFVSLILLMFLSSSIFAHLWLACNLYFQHRIQSSVLEED